MRCVLKVALQPWPTLVGMRSLIECTTRYRVRETYFRADWFCKHDHGNLRERRAIRQRALDRAEGANDGHILPVLECEAFVCKRHPTRTLAQINADWSLVHPVHCLHPRSTVCRQQIGESH